MTALSIPPLERRLLRAIKEEAENEPVRSWPEPSRHTAANLLQQVRHSVAKMQEMLVASLTSGVEAEEFANVAGVALELVAEPVAMIQGFVARLSVADDPSSQSLLSEARELERDLLTFRDSLAEALSKASAPARPDWDRIRASKEAYTAKKSKPFPRQ